MGGLWLFPQNLLYTFMCASPGFPIRLFNVQPWRLGVAQGYFFCLYHGVAQVVYGRALLPMYLAYLSTREN